MTAKVVKEKNAIVEPKTMDDVGIDSEDKSVVKEEPKPVVKEEPKMESKSVKEKTVPKPSPLDDNAMDENKVAGLKAKMGIKPVVSKKQTPPRSLNFGVVGLGQAGSRIAQTFHEMSYNVLAVNTATQDLAHIKIPDNNKLFLDIGLQGAAKDMDRGREAAEANRMLIQEKLESILGENEVIVVASSCGGGSGAGAIDTVVDVLQSTGKPIVVIGVLPMVSEDVRTKANSIETVAKLANLVNENKIQSLVVADNARIESIYSSVGQMDFFNVANAAIVEPIDVFNRYSMMPSDVKSLDSSEWATLLLNGRGLAIYGQMSLSDFNDDTSLAEGVIASLSDNLLASSFDLKQAKYVGFMVVANDHVWSKVPAGAVNYISLVLADTFGDPEGLFKGIYSDNGIADNVVKLYAFVSGLSLPTSRLDGLKTEVAAQHASLKKKDESRANKLNMDVNKDVAVFDVEKLKNKIASKMSGFGKLTKSPMVVDRRKR